MKIYWILLCLFAGAIFTYAQECPSHPPLQVVSDLDWTIDATGNSIETPLPLLTENTVTGAHSLVVLHRYLKIDDQTALAILSVSTGGTGSFYSLYRFKKQPNGTMKEVGKHFLGDRIQPVSLELKNTQTTVRYLDRSSEACFSDPPTQPRLLTLEITQLRPPTNPTK